MFVERAFGPLHVGDRPHLGATSPECPNSRRRHPAFSTLSFPPDAKRIAFYQSLDRVEKPPIIHARATAGSGPPSTR
jgi:hypothetical protein